MTYIDKKDLSILRAIAQSVGFKVDKKGKVIKSERVKQNLIDFLSLYKSRACGLNLEFCYEKETEIEKIKDYLTKEKLRKMGHFVFN